MRSNLVSSVLDSDHNALPYSMMGRHSAEYSLWEVTGWRQPKREPTALRAKKAPAPVLQEVPYAVRETFLAELHKQAFVPYSVECFPGIEVCNIPFLLTLTGVLDGFLQDKRCVQAAIPRAKPTLEGFSLVVGWTILRMIFSYTLEMEDRSEIPL